MNYSELIAKLITLSEMLDEYEGGNFKWSEEAATAREAADALQALERVPMTESGWLIECNIASGAPFWLKPDGEGTNDSNEALRFSRATDAQGFLDSFLVAKYGKDTMGIFKRHYSKEKYSVTEHEWIEAHHNITPPESK